MHSAVRSLVGFVGRWVAKAGGPFGGTRGTQLSAANLLYLYIRCKPVLSYL